MELGKVFRINMKNMKNSKQLAKLTKLELRAGVGSMMQGGYEREEGRGGNLGRVMHKAASGTEYMIYASAGT